MVAELKQSQNSGVNSEERRLQLLNEVMTQPVSDLEQEPQLQLEADILRALVVSKYPRKDLAQIARWNGVTFDEIEAIAKKLAKERGLDLEQLEFNTMVRQVKEVESIVDLGFREWKLQALAKQYRRSRKELMEAYNKALIHQSAIAPLSLSQLKESAKQSTEWTVQGWFPAGVTVLLHGHGGTAKTLFLYEVASAIAKGESWNGYPTKQGEVLILQSDEPPHITHERLENLGISDDDPLHVFPGWQVEKMPQLEEYLRSRHEAGSPIRFVIVDSNTSVNRNTLISENDVEYARPILQLADLAQTYGSTICVVHHSNANGDARGTKAIHNSVSEVWALSIADERNGERLLRVQKNRLGRPPGRYRFEFDANTYTFTFKGEEGDYDGTAATNEKRIELWLNEPERLGIAFATEEVAHHLNINQDSVRRALLELWSKGIVLRKRKTSGRGGGYLYHAGGLQTNVKHGEGSDPRSSLRSSFESNTQQSIQPNMGNSIAKNDKNPISENANSLKTAIEFPMFGCNVDDKKVMELDHELDHPPENSDRVPQVQESDRVPEVGDWVTVKATATWHRYKSDKLPWQEVPKMWRNEATVPIELFGHDLFHEVVDVSKVLGIKDDRIRVRNQQTGRTSVFLIKDVEVLRKADG